MFHIVSRQQVVGELIPSVYKLNHRSYGPHDLALLLIVLAVGALVDLDMAPYNLEAQHYYRLALASLTLQPVLAQQSIVTIKALHLMSIFNGMSGKESNLEDSYTFLNLAGRLALGIGFHVDPSSWGFVGKEAYERRVYFWNLLAAILWQSLVSGRPPAILQTYIHCRKPSEEEEELYQQGEVPLGFGTWGFRASDECLLPAVRATLAVNPPPYSTVMELDKKIRQFATVAHTSDDTNDRTALSMRTFAVTDNPDDPLKSSYAESVSAAYHSACVVLEDTQSQFGKKPLLCARIWRIWSYAFSAAIIIGAAAIHQLHFDPPPFEQFEIACSLFQKAAETSSGAARALPILLKMRSKANMRRNSAPDGLAGRNYSSGSLQGSSSSHPPAPAIQFHYHPLMGEVTSPSDRLVPGRGAPEGWDSLYRETPRASSQNPPHLSEPMPPVVMPPPVASDVAPTFDIRWSSFMRSHGIGRPQSPSG
ncbi:hypothetical protein ONZ45_g14557 [Pleurotus djamor]|nr:hypothetical protein ONZ45_g14557 [Pleurotus djamor]